MDFRRKRREGSQRPAAHIAVLDYAEYIALLTHYGWNIHLVGNAQHLLTTLATNAKTMNLKINVAKTEFMLAGDFPGQPVLMTSSGPIKQMDDFNYLGCWLKDSKKDFLVW